MMKEVSHTLVKKDLVNVNTQEWNMVGLNSFHAKLYQLLVMLLRKLWFLVVNYVKKSMNSILL